MGYSIVMIKSFAHKGLEDFFYEGKKKGIQPKHEKKLSAILDRLDAANEIRDMNFPGHICIYWNLGQITDGR
jgi:proteic killer suppression protein